MSLLSMFYYLAFCSLNSGFAGSLVLPSPDNSDGSISLVRPSSLNPSMNVSGPTDNSTAIENLLLPDFDTSTSLDVAKVDCDERRFGNPPGASCRDAIAQIPQDPRTIIMDPNRSYGPRGEGNWDVNLPKRYISSDGKCIIDLSQDSTPSHVKNNDLLGAGHIIQHECVEKDTPPWGGIAWDMGDEVNFNFTMKAYQPPFIRCAGTTSSPRPVSASCQTILDTMKASVGTITFGAVGTAGVEEHLPQVLTEPTGQCSISIDTTAPDDTASWYDLWQAANALDGMCARAGRTGKARFLGTNRKLAMEIMK